MGVDGQRRLHLLPGGQGFRTQAEQLRISKRDGRARLPHQANDLAEGGAGGLIGHVHEMGHAGVGVQMPYPAHDPFDGGKPGQQRSWPGG